jgi:hypothetical protein
MPFRSNPLAKLRLALEFLHLQLYVLPAFANIEPGLHVRRRLSTLFAASVRQQQQ